MPKVSLVAELCRLFTSTDVAMLCAMSHGQVRVSGHVVKPQHDMAWTQAQLSGRMAHLLGKGQAALFDGGVASDSATQDLASEAA